MEIAIKNESFSEIGDLTDCFHSFFLMDGVLHSVHRRHRLFSFPQWPGSRKENISRIVLTRYKNRDINAGEHEEILCDGNDPRVVGVGDKAYVLSQGALHTNVLHLLTTLPAGRTIEIKTGEGARAGKNWQPFVKDNELYVVDGISPFRLNRISDGIISMEREVPHDLVMNAGHDHFSILRGGSNAVLHEGALWGWGHATVAEYRHIPYIWKYNGDSVTTCFTNIHGIFAARGYNIVDPTCFFEWDENHFALGLSCSQRDWFHPQWFLNVLLIFKKDDFFTFSPFDFSNSDMGIKRKSIIYHAQELTTLIDAVKETGGLSSKGRGGCLVCGPSREIHTTDAWVVELCYSSPAKTSKHVGDFDILLTSQGRDHQVAKTRLYGTEGKSTRVRLKFKFASPGNKALIQTRVFARRNRDVTAYFFELFND